MNPVVEGGIIGGDYSGRAKAERAQGGSRQRIFCGVLIRGVGLGPFAQGFHHFGQAFAFGLVALHDFALTHQRTGKLGGFKSAGEKILVGRTEGAENGFLLLIQGGKLFSV
ncbi:hypothetical protein [Anaerolinea thermolimosa]|uniref:hypothetical protein n=1 Tax=Anaerolinea thermolimosa TaxID=229919 RepID=UPI000A0558DD